MVADWFGIQSNLGEPARELWNPTWKMNAEKESRDYSRERQPGIKPRTCSSRDVHHLRLPRKLWRRLLRLLRLQRLGERLDARQGQG
jgi:hypothetical protein